MKFRKVETAYGISFEFEMSNLEVQDLVSIRSSLLGDHWFYHRAIYEVLEHMIRLNERLEDARYVRERRNLRECEACFAKPSELCKDTCPSVGSEE